jgi:hypothetical protein
MGFVSLDIALPNARIFFIGLEKTKIFSSCVESKVSGI